MILKVFCNLYDSVILGLCVLPPGLSLARLLSSHSSPSLYLCPALPHPRCRIRHFYLLNFIPLIIAQCSNLSRSCCKASCPSRESMAPPSLVSSANLLMVHSTAASRSFINILNRSGPRIEP
ncbi:hypothetical protein QYF61_005012 [Mycteria americana]|uniref:Uncharacterized protein n=1 Tax=Mycteria americana TaxID=33587 RepID=A0AAN7NXJ8_MYCAM|nr:hypothetical protein QYF61_005012 [Mycteria americana]